MPAAQHSLSTRNRTGRALRLAQAAVRCDGRETGVGQGICWNSVSLAAWPLLCVMYLALDSLDQAARAPPMPPPMPPKCMRWPPPPPPPPLLPPPPKGFESPKKALKMSRGSPCAERFRNDHGSPDATGLGLLIWVLCHPVIIMMDRWNDGCGLYMHRQWRQLPHFATSLRRLFSAAMRHGRGFPLPHASLFMHVRRY